MNHVPRRDHRAEEASHVREVVSRHPVPEFVSGFDVQFGEFDGDPAMWIVFYTVDRPTGARPVLKARGNALYALRRAVKDDLLNEVDDRYPYFRFQPAPASLSGAD